MVGARATSDIDPDDRDAGGVNGLHEVLLVLEEFNGLDVALEFRVRHLPQEHHGTLRGPWTEGACDRVDVRLVKFHVQFGEGNAVRAEDLAHGLDGGGAAWCVVLRVLSLPGSGPSAVQGVQAVRCGARHQDSPRASNGENGLIGVDDVLALILQEGDALQGGPGSGAFKAGLVRIILEGRGHASRLEEAAVIFDAQDASDALVQSGFGDAAFADELGQQHRKERIGRHHAHVDAGMDGHLDGVLVIGGHLVALEEVSDVLPIGHDQTFESELIPKDVREDVTVRVDGDAIGLAAVDHDGGGAGFDGCSERREEDVPQLALGDPGRRAVLAGQRAAVAHVVFEAGRNGRGAFLVSLDHGHAHVGHQPRGFAKGFPESGPTGVAGDVQNR